MLTVDTTSWHYRIYMHWRRKIALHPPAKIDLCHYMRAIMLWTPGYYVSMGLWYTLQALAAVAAGVFLALTCWLWFPVWCVTHNKDWHKRGALRFQQWTVVKGYAVAAWLKTGGQYIMISIGVGFLMLICVMATLNSGWQFWLWTTVVLSICAGCLVGIALIAWGVDTLDKRSKRINEEVRLGLRPVKPPNPPKGPSMLSLFWQWMKAKKKRICPLIETTERRTHV